jgi:TolB-like protein
MQSQSEGIAVLPFRNLSLEPDNEYFSDGITEELINALTRVNGLNVIARTSAFAFRGKDMDLREVGTQLNVAYIIEGSVRKSGNRVRVTVQLIKASDGFHVFSEVFQRELQDIFDIQDDIAGNVVAKFREILGLRETEKRPARSSAGDVEAYDLCLKGRFHANKGSVEDARTAIQYFETALKKDRNLVPALTGLSACYTFLGGSGQMDRNEAFLKAREYAEKSMSIDQSVAENHLALANSYFWHDWDFENTEISIKNAIRLSPGSSAVHGLSALFLIASGRHEDALIEASLATRLDPLSLKEQFQLGEIHYRSGRFLDAIKAFDEILVENPYFQQASIFKAWCHLFTGEPEKAEAIFQNVPLSADASFVFYGGLAIAYGKRKQTGKILDTLKTFKSEISRGYDRWINYNYTLIYRSLGETERMYEQLEICLKEKISPLIFIKSDPLWKEFMGETRFLALIDKYFNPVNKYGKITIHSDTRETLEINPGKLVCIEAQENYSRLVWLEDGKIREKFLRVTLKNIEHQLKDTRIIRCHRSYLINPDIRFSVLGNSNGYRLKPEYLSENIPVSRSLGKEIVARLHDSSQK